MWPLEHLLSTLEIAAIRWGGFGTRPWWLALLACGGAFYGGGGEGVSKCCAPCRAMP